ncbi:MAG: hypothetical protein NE334_14655 [Lentisphaeraceae bacterium]|nr:hypothetical protein [Lentisphaeraceae bacterium]
MKKLLTVALSCGLLASLYSQEITLKHTGPEKPFRPLAKFKDHSLTVFATAPEVNSPVSVIAEPGGALYALCDDNAGLGLGKDNGKIYRLVDKDGDGKADAMTKFVANINTPRGGHFVDGVLYVMHPPFISSFKDTDGDGVADEHKVLAKGFGHDLNWRRGGDHTANDLRIGIDGWIYTALGDFGATATGSDGSKVTLYSGGVIRMRIDGSDLQLYTQGTRNTYDLGIDHKLDMITLDNTNDGDGWNARVHHLTPLAHMGYPNLYKFFSEDAMPPLFDHGGGSGVGALHLQEPGFPEWFNNRFHTMSWGKMYTHTLKPHDATFINNDIISLQISKLVEVDVDGSSRLYFSTFENGGARTKPGTTVGQILQARPHGWQYKAFPNLKSLSVEELITSLDKGSNVLRQNAQHELIKRPESIEDVLLTKAHDKMASIEARIAALYAINLRNKAGTADTLKSLLKDDSIREYALRALIDRQDNHELGLLPAIKEGLSDANPRVQMIAAFGARRLNFKGLTNDLLMVSDDSKERTPLVQSKPHIHRAVPHTARRALIEMAPISELLAAVKVPTLRDAALAVLRQIHNKHASLELIKEMNLADSFETKLPFIKVLLRTYNKEDKWNGKDWWGTKPNSSGPYYKAVKWEMSETIAAALREEVNNMNEEQQKEVLFQVRLHNVNFDELKLNIKIDPLEQLVNQSSHSFSQLNALLSVVQDQNRTENFRIKAFRAALSVEGFRYKEWAIALLETLKQVPEDSSLFKTFSSDFITSPSHRVTFIQRIGKTYPQVRKLPSHLHRLFCDMVVGLTISPLTKESDRKRLESDFQKVFNIELIESIEANKAKNFTKYLNKATRKKDTNIANAAKNALATLTSQTNVMANTLVGEIEFEKMKSLVMNMSGDIETGKKLLTRQSCIACHSVLPSEPQKGPYLGTVGNLFNREQLIIHVVKPNAEVAQGFQSYNYSLKDGSLASGFVTSKDDKQITLRSMVGTVQKINKTNIIKESVSKNSMMPPGLVNALSIKEFASLIDYLQSLH